MVCKEESQAQRRKHQHSSIWDVYIKPLLMASCKTSVYWRSITFAGQAARPFPRQRQAVTNNPTAFLNKYTFITTWTQGVSQGAGRMHTHRKMTYQFIHEVWIWTACQEICAHQSLLWKHMAPKGIPKRRVHSTHTGLQQNWYWILKHAIKKQILYFSKTQGCCRFIQVSELDLYLHLEGFTYTNNYITAQSERMLSEQLTTRSS